MTKAKSLLPEKDFRLYAVCTREPRKLAKQTLLRPIKPGVYEVTWGCRSIRIIVLNQIPMVERNALWQIFSNIPEGVQFGAKHYGWRNMDHSPIVNELFEHYHVEVKPMPYTWNDYYLDKALAQEDELLARLPVEKRLKGLRAEERLKGLRTEERLKGLRAEERMKGLSAKEIEAYLNKLRKRNPQK